MALRMLKPGTTRTFASLGSLVLNQRSGKKVLSKRRDQEPNVDHFHRSCVRMGECSRRSTTNASMQRCSDLSCIGERTDIGPQWRRDGYLRSQMEFLKSI